MTLDCKTCGACCGGQLIILGKWDKKVPVLLRNGMCMRTQGDRCAALTGRIGVDPRCSIYKDRPRICRVFAPGSDQCKFLREAYYIGERHGAARRA